MEKATSNNIEKAALAAGIGMLALALNPQPLPGWAGCMSGFSYWCLAGPGWCADTGGHSIGSGWPPSYEGNGMCVNIC